MSTEFQRPQEERQFMSNITRNGADCTILFQNDDYDGYPRCVNKNSSCVDCPIAKGFKANSKLTGKELAKLHSEALKLIKP